MTGLLPDEADVDFADAGATLAALAPRIAQGEIVPYLGPGALGADAPVPASPEALAEFLGAKVALPARARGNVWAAAQFIESRRHRNTVTALMDEAFAPPVVPGPLHAALARMGAPMIVSTWYDAAMRRALAEAGADFGEVQGITRAAIGETEWYRFYDAAGDEVAAPAAWRTVLYTPHGGTRPAHNYLISDADYVETLTEIDIQTPIPDIVAERRAGRSFLFLGCRFHDQLLRTYARQIAKRSSGPHVAVFDPGTALTRNERRFLAAEGIVPVAAPLLTLASALLQPA
ncbi:SIR2 family protein [Acuticoccus sediminis]|uniref:SIR2 family protein n=1 Tax=Acuticoccus sediminis TaxID=2184697 RepID=A0A8B2NM76_9HYPH|nr:SIR2 family protein [Acuticoccus sediminis]RAI00727.1 SIR2 family protein [Acuticoccus sediminis]